MLLIPDLLACISRCGQHPEGYGLRLPGRWVYVRLALAVHRRRSRPSQKPDGLEWQCATPTIASVSATTSSHEWGKRKRSEFWYSTRIYDCLSCFIPGMGPLELGGRGGYPSPSFRVGPAWSRSWSAASTTYATLSSRRSPARTSSSRSLPTSPWRRRGSCGRLSRSLEPGGNDRLMNLEVLRGKMEGDDFFSMKILELEQWRDHLNS